MEVEAMSLKEKAKRLYRKMWNKKKRLSMIFFPRALFMNLMCIHCGHLGKDHCKDAGEYYNRPENPCRECDCEDFEEA